MIRLTPRARRIRSRRSHPAGKLAWTDFGDGTGYDAVVLDQKMPGLDGLETLKRIKERAPEARVLMVTAFASTELAVDAMRLGATDFLRKPMTPETLRGAVAAAIVGTPPRPQRPGPAPAPPATFDIAVLTMNGFQILRSPDPPALPSAEHVFRVRHVPDGAEVVVTVTIDHEAVERVARLTHRRLEAWRRLRSGRRPERPLSAYVWSEGKGPSDGRLTVRDVSREDLDVAARWPESEPGAGRDTQRAP